MWLCIRDVSQCGAVAWFAPLKEGETTIGRDASCSIRLLANRVSRKHILIERRGDDVSFSDLGSSSGVLHNGRDLVRGELSSGDVLVIGDARIEFSRDAPDKIPSGQSNGASSSGKQLGVFACFVERLRSSSDTKTLLEELMRGLLDMLDAERGLVIITKKSRGLGTGLAVVASHSIDDDQQVQNLSRTICRRAMEERRVIYIEDSHIDPSSKIATSLGGEAPRSIICGPLAAGKNMFGVLYVDMPRKKTAVNKEKIDFFKTITGLASGLIMAGETRKRLLLAHSRLKIIDEVNASSQRLILGKSESSERLMSLIRAAASQDSTVLITGETGTGKEMVALELHRLSGRSTGPFLPVNCAALPRDMMEAELFGYEKGAFTGAAERRLGRFELASGGTLFLDEIGELPLDVQVKLLRVLQERSIVRLGGTEVVPLDFRLVCATNADVEQGVRDGGIRKDFYFRINVFRIQLEPLRRRRQDIQPLAMYFLNFFSIRFSRRFEGFSPDALKLLHSYAWPGNIRELRNAIERAAAVEQGRVITPGSLPINGRGERIQSGDRFFDVIPSDYESAKEAFESEFFRRTVAANRGNISAVARETGLRRNTIYRKLAKYGIQIDRN